MRTRSSVGALDTIDGIANPQTSIRLGRKTAASRNGFSDVEYSGDGHIITLAPTGAGKGVGVVIPTLLTYPGSAIVIDVKGENAQVTARRRQEMGQQVVILDPFHVITEESDRLNPFDLFQLPRSEIETDSAMLARLFAPNESFDRDPYWDNMGRGLLCGLITQVVQESPPESRSLVPILNYLCDPDISMTLAKKLDARQVKSRLAYVEFAGFLAAPDKETRPCILATTFSMVKNLSADPVLAATQRSTFDLNDLLNDEPITIYIVMPPEKLVSHSSLLRLWIGVLMTTVMRRSTVPAIPTLFMLDEAAQLGTLDQLRMAMTLLRGYGLRVWTLWQDPSQLMNLCRNDWETIVNNAGVMQAFGVPGHGALAGWERLLGRDDAQRVRELPVGEMFVSIARQQSITCNRLDYRTDPALDGLWDANPRFIA